MKKNPILILKILVSVGFFGASFSSIAHATEYYVSTVNGSDSNPGTSALPFQTVQKCANLAKAGDTCDIGSGTYREMVTLKNSGSSSAPITFTGMPGQTATISGADVITGWTQYSGNIYVANTVFTVPPTQLYVDGQFYDIAHYPNSGYLTATANSTDTQSIIDSNLSLTPAQVVGATVITRSVNWALSSNTATAYNNGTITLNGTIYNSQIMQAQYGFYLQNMLWMLNSPGEWFYDVSAGKLYVWTTASDNPNNHTVEVPNRSYGIYDLGPINYITFQNLAIANANQYDVSLNNANNVTLNNLTISGGQTGIESYGLTNSTLENNTLQNTLSTGIQLTSSNNINVFNNTINNAGNVGTPKQSMGALEVNGTGTNVTVNGNTITNSGYAGIWYAGNLGIIKNNTIDKSCLVLDDCGGIYANSNEPLGLTNTISGNTITNSIGNINGTPDTFTLGLGIYLDDLSSGYTLSNNTITNADWGIFIQNGSNNTVTGNKVYAARMYGFQLSENNYGGTVRDIAGVVKNNTITGNTFETAANSKVNFMYGSGSAGYLSIFGSDIANFGLINSNQYCHPNISYAVGALNVNKVTSYSLSNWQQATGQDLNSTDTNSSCAPQIALTLTETGAGSGSISSAPAGVNCSSATCTASFNTGTDVTLTAAANSGSVFSGWSGACSGTGSCSVLMNSAQNVTANFNTQYNLTVSTTGNGFGEVFFSNVINCGVNATACSQTLSSGTTAVLTATAANDSVFNGWSGACSGTGNCTVTMNANTNVVANFIFQPNTITASAGTGGTITPSGAVSVNYEASQMFTVTPNTGYTPQLTVDGAVVALSNNAYTLNNVTAAHTIAASFTLNTYMMNISADSNSTISPATATVNYGGSQTFTVTPAVGYTASLSVDGATVPLTNNSYALSNVTTTHTIAASSTLNTYMMNISAGSNGTISPSTATVAYGGNQVFTVTPNTGYTPQLIVDGTVVTLTNNTYTLSNVTTTHTVAASFTLQTENITASASTGGAINPSGTVNVNYGASQIFTVTPNAGYTPQLMVDGTVVTLTNNTYTLSNVTTAHTIAASFTLNTYTMNISANSNGAISPMTATVAYGASQVFTVTPAAGYTASLTVDGILVVLNNNTYSLNNVTAAHAVAASFTLNTYMMNVSAGNNGTISPMTASIAYGASQVFTVTPAIGYAANLTVDGVPVVLTNNTYTLSNVTANHTIAANFVNITKYTLAVSTTGNVYGAVYGAGLACGASATICSQNLLSGTVITALTAVAPAGSVFTGWSGACSGTGTCSVTMNSNQSVVANFTPFTKHTLAASTTGNGSGAVYGAGLACGAGAAVCSQSLENGTVITALAAVPAKGSVFLGWSGACSGTGICSVIMNSNVNVTANFSS